jgi:predicted phage-related endonuclease
MSRTDINNTVKEIRELKRMREELDAEIAAAEDLIKAEMDRTSNYTIVGDDYKVTWNEVTSSRVDTTALKKAMPEVIEKFMKTTTSRRFCIA